VRTKTCGVDPLQRVHRKLARFTVRLQTEAIDQQRAQHCGRLFGRGAGACACLEIEPRFGQRRRENQLVVAQTVRSLNELTQRQVDREDTPARLKSRQYLQRSTRAIRLDRRDLKGRVRRRLGGGRQ
jgi:hypothetical protein